MVSPYPANGSNQATSSLGHAGRSPAGRDPADQRLQRSALELLADEELERGPVEPFGVFVQGGVREVLADRQLATLDAFARGI